MKNRSGEKIKLASIDELLGVVNEESAMEIEISKIHPFKNHPFKVLDDEKMQDLVESVIKTVALGNNETLDELITEYVALYGKENWALSTYEGNVSLINNYILPVIGDAKLSEINTRFIERYYQSLLKRRAVINPLNKTSRNEFVSSSTVRDVNKLLRNCFEQAVKWELGSYLTCPYYVTVGIAVTTNNFWGYVLGVLGFGVAVVGCFLKDNH